ncbi:MAG: VOC family protein [Chloroflexi bacterium]|nr:VOC family protein [Chloroflexota bacterium]
MAITCVQVVSVPVADQDRAKAFYVDTLGFELLGDNVFGDGMRWVQVAPRGTATSLTLVTWFPSMPPGSLKGLVLAVDDVEATYHELASRGVQFDGPLQDAPWGKFATFNDPDGNGLILQGAPAA